MPSSATLKEPLRLNIMVFCPEHLKRDQNLKFTPPSETTRMPAPFMWELPPRIVLFLKCLLSKFQFDLERKDTFKRVHVLSFVGKQIWQFTIYNSIYKELHETNTKFHPRKIISLDLY